MPLGLQERVTIFSLFKNDQQNRIETFSHTKHQLQKQFSHHEIPSWNLILKPVTHPQAWNCGGKSKDSLRLLEVVFLHISELQVLHQGPNALCTDRWEPSLTSWMFCKGIIICKQSYINHGSRKVWMWNAVVAAQNSFKIRFNSWTPWSNTVVERQNQCRFNEYYSPLFNRLDLFPP